MNCHEDLFWLNQAWSQASRGSPPLLRGSSAAREEFGIAKDVWFDVVVSAGLLPIASLYREFDGGRCRAWY